MFGDIQKTNGFLQVYREIKSQLVDPTDICIGGSVGLLIYGYDLGRPIKDVDFLAKSEEIIDDVLDFFEDLKVLKESEQYSATDFYWCGYIRNIHCEFAVRPFSEIPTEKLFKGTYVSIPPLSNIIDYKLKYSRGNAESCYKHARDIELLRAQNCPIYVDQVQPWDL